jgi:hypothetical protein
MKYKVDQRVRFFYGYYAKHPHYRDDIGAFVDAIYEPEKSNNCNGFDLK